MKKKLLSTILALAMLCTLSITAFAADGEEATAPNGTAPEAGTVVSTGSASTTGDGITWNTEGDDDALAKAADNNGADINVWAKVIDSSTPTYKIDIAWGAMKFEYNSGEGNWNTTTHTYEGAGTAAWTVATYLDELNNKVTVTNHSNKAVDAGFAYAMNADVNLFNDAQTTTSVVGNFFADNTKALAAALVLADNTQVKDALAGNTIPLHTADKYFASALDKTNNTETPVFTDANKITTGREKPVYFAFSGKPDAGKGATLDTFTKVGVITVTVSPIADLTGFEF